MKKITLFLLTTMLMHTCITGMEMDVEEYRHTSTETSEQSNTSHITSSNHTNKLLKQNNALLKDLVVLTHTKIMQDKIHFEYHDNKQHETKVPMDQHAREAQTALNNTYKSANAQLKNKALHIPMTGATITTTAQATKSSKTEESII